MKTVTIERQSLLSDAFGILLKNLGPQKAVRLWQVIAPPFPDGADYTKIRKQIFKGKTVEDICREAKEFNKK